MKASAGRQRRALALDRLRDPGRRDQPADDALAVIGLEPVDPHDSSGSRFQIGSNRPVTMWRLLSVNSGTVATSASQARGEVRPVRLPPMRLRHARDRRSRRRSIGRSRRTRRSTSPSSSIRLGAGTCTAARPDWALTSSFARGIVGPFQRLGERQRLVAVAARDGEHLRLGAGLRMDVDRAAIGDDQALGRQRLDAEIVGAGRDRALDPGRAADPRTRRTACSAGRWSAPAAG